MILEILNFLATWPLTAPAQRRAIKASVSLWSRAGRCASAWALHEENSQNAVLGAMARTTQHRTAVVLGSGLLRDVPIKTIARHFDRVVLVDLVHLASVRLWLRAKGFGNVEMIGRDLSGYDRLKAGHAPDPLAFLRDMADVDLVVSANLLSQLGCGVRSRLSLEPAGGMPEDTPERLVRAHLDGLAQLSATICLITDISYQRLDAQGQVLEAEDLLCGVAAPRARQSWSWPVAPPGEEGDGVWRVHQVIAV
ncbi:MAG: hypothetical protein ACOH2J_03825 [Allorhizobium sp.]